MLTTLIVSTSVLAVSSGDGDASLDTQAQALIDQIDAPGAAIGLECDAGFSEGTAGVRIAGTEAAIAPGDLWHHGSNTKAMTATLAARLVEHGLISWETTIGEVLNERFAAIESSLKDVSLSELLSHRGGLIANPSVEVMRALGGRDAERDEISDRMAYVEAGLEQSGGPRGEFLYSNVGYVVASLMLETVGGEPYEALMQREVFVPLGMNSASWGVPGDPGQADQPRGHLFNPDAGLIPLEPSGGADNPPAMNAAGRAHMTLEDMADFLRAHATKPSDYLSPESWERLHAAVDGGNYALGWSVSPGNVLVHSGSNGRWYSQMALEPNSGCTIVVSTNSGQVADIAAPVGVTLSTVLSAAISNR